MTDVLKANYRQVLRDHPELINREMYYENLAAGIGQDKIRKKVEERGLLENSPTTRSAIGKYIKITGETTDEWLAEQKLLPRPSNGYVNMLLLSTEQMAFITAKTLLNEVGKRSISRTAAANKISRHIQEAVDYELFKEKNPEAEKAVSKKTSRSTNARYNRAVVSAGKRNASFTSIKWDVKVSTAVGCHLINHFIKATGLFAKSVTHTNRERSKTYLVTTDKLMAMMLEGHLRDHLILPYHLPMVIPPRPWTDPETGGYHCPELHPMRLVKSDAKTAAKIAATDIEFTMAGVNAAQNTAWMINKTVLAELKHLHDTDEGGGKLVGRTPPALEEKPWPKTLTTQQLIEWSDMPGNQELMQAYKAAAVPKYAALEKWKSHRGIQEQQIEIADLLKDEAGIWYVHQCDFRGRIYPAAGVGNVNPQGTDAAKGLLSFARGNALGDTGAYWVAIQTANTFGIDKVSLNDRIEWVEANSSWIAKCGEDPRANREWLKADKPFQFLAACIEWKGYLEQGDSFISHLVIAQDGSCNAMQLMAAVMRCPITAKSTNVLPAEVPEDLYGDVLEALEVLVELSEEDEAKEWRTRLHRDVVKAPTMTTGYGVTDAGIKAQIKQNIIKLVDAGKIKPFVNLSPKEAARWLGPKVSECIQGRAAAASVCMDWLKHVALVTGKAGKNIHWETKTGFTVFQDYRKNKQGMCNIFIDGKREQIRTVEKTLEVNPTKAKQGISPNLIHSLDAAMLVCTINNCEDLYNIKDFACVHDSYGVPACFVDDLSCVIRESFVEMFRDDVLGDFYEQLRGQLEPAVFKRLKPPPPLGTLDIEAVRDSLYFFA